MKRERSIGRTGKVWSLTAERTWIPDPGQGAMLKPFQPPRCSAAGTTGPTPVAMRRSMQLLAEEVLPPINRSLGETGSSG